MSMTSEHRTHRKLWLIALGIPAKLGCTPRSERKVPAAACPGLLLSYSSLVVKGQKDPGCPAICVDGIRVPSHEIVNP